MEVFSTAMDRLAETIDDTIIKIKADSTPMLELEAERTVSRLTEHVYVHNLGHSLPRRADSRLD